MLLFLCRKEYFCFAEHHRKQRAVIHQFSKGSHHMFLPAVGQRQVYGMINLKINEKKNKRQVSPKMVSNKCQILPRRHYGNAKLPIGILQRIRAEKGRNPSKGRSTSKMNVKKKKKDECEITYQAFEFCLTNIFSFSVLMKIFFL